MKLNKRNISILLSIILCGVLFVFLWNENKQREFYESELHGIIEEIEVSKKFENSKTIRCTGDKDFSYKFWIYTKDENDLKIGDSISKAKNSNSYRI